MTHSTVWTSPLIGYMLCCQFDYLTFLNVKFFYYRWLMCLLIILPAVNRCAILNSVSQFCGSEYKPGSRLFGSGFGYRSFVDTAKKNWEILQNFDKKIVGLFLLIVNEFQTKERSLAQVFKKGNIFIFFLFYLPSRQWIWIPGSKFWSGSAVSVESGSYSAAKFVVPDWRI